MTRKHRSHHASHAPAASPADAEPVELREGEGAAPMDPGGAAPEAAVASAEGAMSAPPEALEQLEREAAEWKDRCLRTAAEFENFKKRAVRERTESWRQAQADVIARTLDALDDLGRIAALDPAQTGVQALHEGVGLVERKLLKALEGIGVERLDPAGEPFDPQLHEAVMTMPAPSADVDHTVGSVLQPGYRLNGILVRPARVAVLQWTGPSGGAPGE